MGDLVFTKLGHIDEDLLERRVTTEDGPNYFKVYTAWHMKEDLVVNGETLARAGEEMRKDAAPSIKAGLGAVSIHGKLNGRG